MTRHKTFCRDNAGVTLVELLIGIVIVMVLIGALGFDYRGWQGNYKVESETKQIYADILNARVRAMQTDRIHFLKFLGGAADHSYSSYEVVEDTNGDGVENAGDTVLTGFPKTLQYPVWWADDTGTDRCDTVSFSTKGLIGITDSDCVTPENIAYVKTKTSLDSKISPDVNCITVQQTIVDTGQMPYDPNNAFAAGSTCNAK